jgi:beta-glucosidase
MASFNEISGIPSTGNEWLMRGILRGEWGFERLRRLRLHRRHGDDRPRLREGFARGRQARFLAGRRHEHDQRLLPQAPARAGRGRRSAAGASRRVGAESPRDQGARSACSTIPSAASISSAKRRARGPSRRSICRARPGASRSSCSRTKAICCRLPKSGKKIAIIGPFASGKHDLNGPGWSMAATTMPSISPRASRPR